MNHIDTNLDKSKFTVDEDVALLRSLLQLGFGKWHDISEALNKNSVKHHHRNEIQIKNRMRCLQVHMKDLGLLVDAINLNASIMTFINRLTDQAVNRRN
jgi:hypothetical protein